MQFSKCGPQTSEYLRDTIRGLMKSKLAHNNTKTAFAFFRCIDVNNEDAKKQQQVNCRCLISKSKQWHQTVLPAGKKEKQIGSICAC